MTSDSGIYVFSFLKPGEYTLAVEHRSFPASDAEPYGCFWAKTVTANLKIDLEKASARIDGDRRRSNSSNRRCEHHGGTFRIAK